MTSSTSSPSIFRPKGRPPRGSIRAKAPSRTNRHTSWAVATGGWRWLVVVLVATSPQQSASLRGVFLPNRGKMGATGALLPMHAQPGQPANQPTSPAGAASRANAGPEDHPPVHLPGAKSRRVERIKSEQIAVPRIIWSVRSMEADCLMPTKLLLAPKTAEQGETPFCLKGMQK